MEELLKGVEAKIAELTKDGIKKDSIDYVYKLVDIHKDIKYEDYMKVKEEKYNAEIQRI
jgi:hypothetical protein